MFRFSVVVTSLFASLISNGRQLLERSNLRRNLFNLAKKNKSVWNMVVCMSVENEARKGQLVLSS